MADLMVEDTANQLSLFQDVLSANPKLKSDMAANMKEYESRYGWWNINPPGLEDISDGGPTPVCEISL